MKFQFCGNVSCPEWFIAEMSVLTKITAIKMKLIFTQLIVHYLEGTDISASITKLFNNIGLDIYEVNAVVSTLNFILHNSVQSHVSDTTLYKELIDLGLPKQNVESIVKTYKTNRDKLLQRSLDKMLKMSNQLELEYSIHEFVGSSALGSTAIAPVVMAELNLNYRDLGGLEREVDFYLGEDDIEELIAEMEDALAVVENLEVGK